MQIHKTERIIQLQRDGVKLDRLIQDKKPRLKEVFMRAPGMMF